MYAEAGQAHAQPIYHIVGAQIRLVLFRMKIDLRLLMVYLWEGLK